MKAKTIKSLLNASYDEKPPDKLKNGLRLDKELTTPTVKTYYNKNNNEAYVVHRGTQGASDWLNNVAYLTGNYKRTDRFKQAEKIQNKAEEKYGKSNISTLGHSQGSVLARELGKDTKQVINVNPAYKFEKPLKNEYNIRSSGDVVSALYAPVAKAREVLYPNYSKAHDITIESPKKSNILDEHSYNILDRLGKKEIGVGASDGIRQQDINKGFRNNI
jgi:hypothetical protein